jgi:beta-lactam-binding protein with PASTA domain
LSVPENPPPPSGPGRRFFFRRPQPRAQAVGETVVEEGGPPPGPPPPPDWLWWPWLLLLLVLVGGGLLAWWLVSRDDNHKTTTTVAVTQSSVTVPRVVGSSENDAFATLGRLGLTPQVQRTQSVQPAGKVLGQNPATGTVAKPGSVVKLIVSSGQGAISVPNVVGSSAASAARRLSAAGLESSTKVVPSNQSRGTVVSQTPAAGDKVAKGTAVLLDVSQGQVKVTVPNLVGTNEQEATAKLAKAGFTATVFRFPNPQPAGRVIAQSPAPGTQVAKGSAVRLNISAGQATTQTQTQTVATTVTTASTVPAPTTTAPATTASPEAATVPDVVGLQRVQAQQLIRGAGLVTEVKGYPSIKPEGTVLGQSPKAGTTLKPGAHVFITVASGAKPTSPGSTTAPATTTAPTTTG